MKPSNTIVVSPKYIEEKEHQIADLSKKVERLQEQLESDEMALTESQEIIAELKAQINEANEVIKLYYKPIVVTRQITDDYVVTEEIPTDSSVAFNYLEKWGVK